MEMEKPVPESKTCPRPRGSAPEAGAQLSWVVWEASSNVALGLGTLLLIVALSVAISVSLGSRYYGGMALVVMLLAVLPFFLPTRYLLDEEGVQVRNLMGNRHKPWANLKVYFLDGERGVLLSPVAKYGPVARARGLYLPLRGDAAAARALIARHLADGGAAK